MEFVIVKYPEERDVYVDDQVIGVTNQTLEIDTGHYTFTLGEPQDYIPEEQTVEVIGTNPIIPLELEFIPEGGV